MADPKKSGDGARRIGEGWRGEPRRERVLLVERWIGEGMQHNEIRRTLMARFEIEKRQAEYDIATAYKRLREESEEPAGIRAARVRAIVIRRIARLEKRADTAEKGAASFEVAANQMVSALARIDGAYAPTKLEITNKETVGVNGDVETLLAALDSRGRACFAEVWRQWEAKGLVGEQAAAAAEEDDGIDTPEPKALPEPAGPVN